MKMRISAALLLSGGLLVGCMNSKPAGHPDATAQQNAKPTPEPTLTANTRFAAGQVAESQNDPDRAIVQYEEAIKLDPKFSMPLLRLGILYTRGEQFDQAINVWNRYIKATNGAAAGYSDLGYTLELAKRLPAAEAAFKTGIAKDPRNEACRVNYGLMLVRQNRTDEATAQMSTVLSKSQVHYNIASVLESQGKKAAARAEFEKRSQSTRT